MKRVEPCPATCPDTGQPLVCEPGVMFNRYWYGPGCCDFYDVNTQAWHDRELARRPLPGYARPAFPIGSRFD